MESQKHKELKKEAINWLFNQGCVVVGEEVGFKNEIYDAVGIKRNGIAYCIEAKATQKDLERARQERINIYKRPFAFYYLIVSPELTFQYGSFEGWGIIKNGSVVKKAKRFEPYTSFSDLMDLIFAMAWNLSWRVYQKSGNNQK